RGSARRLVLDGDTLTDDQLQIRRLIQADEEGALVIASTDASEQHLHHVAMDGTTTRLTHAAGLHTAAAAGPVVVVSSASMQHDLWQTTVMRNGQRAGAIENLAEQPTITPSVAFHRAGERRLHSAVLLPSGANPDTPLPVLLDPYAGPHAQRVLKSRTPLGVSQWFADQGFAVVITDGRGTPGRGPAFERAVWGDLAQPVLDDQLAALDHVALEYPGMDLDRVGIRGWSFGGYLAALALLRRPDRFHAAVAGAPVTDWRLYDTHYTERYLGHPDTHPEHYERTNLTAEAEQLTRPLLLIHGLADDNVVVAHTLKLSRALLEAGRPHQVLPLSGITHMTPQEVVAENLLLLQATFLRDALGDA
ncbi:MAG: S9 family peptidase, partial [Acidimicrobiales bacterium]